MTTIKLTVKEYKENEDIQRELEKERLYLLEQAERLNEIEKQIIDRFQEAEEIQAYSEEIDRYCREQGLSNYQYEKQCYWAERGVGDYPEPERNNQERDIGVEHSFDR